MNAKSTRLKSIQGILAFHFPAIFFGIFSILAVSPIAGAIPKYKVYAVLWLFLFVLPIGFLIRLIASKLSLTGPLQGFLLRAGFLSATWVVLLMFMYFLALSVIWVTTGFGGGALPLGMDAFRAFTKGAIGLLPAVLITCVALCLLGSFSIRRQQSQGTAHA